MRVLKRGKPWTVEENEVLRKRYRKEDASAQLQAQLGRSARAIRAQAARLGLRVPRRALLRIRTVAARGRVDGKGARAPTLQRQLVGAELAAALHVTGWHA